MFMDESLWIPEPNSGCFLWLGTIRLCAGHWRPLATVKGVRDYAYRHAWRVVGKDIPAGGFVLHRCDVPLCVNPDHLFLGDQAENMRDKKRKGRAFNTYQAGKTHCPAGHEYTPENTRIAVVRSYAYRVCKTCSRASVNKLQAKRKALAVSGFASGETS